MKFKEKFILVNGKKVSYFDEGSKERKAVVFLHGWGGSKEQYAGLIDCLSPYFRVIILDLPGHGGSEALEKYSIEEYAQFIKDFIRNIRVEKFNLVGFSIGGGVALIIGLFFPSHVNKIIIWEPAINLKDLKRYKLFNFLLKSIRNKKQLQQRIYSFVTSCRMSKLAKKILGQETTEAFKNADSATLINLGVSLLEKNINDENLKIDKEVLIIYGHYNDVLVPRKKVLELGQILPKAILKEVEGAQHFSRDVSKVYDEILRFLLDDEKTKLDSK